MMRFCKPIVPAVVLAAIALLTLHDAAHAYIDPGIGGMLLQLLLGGIAGALVVIKLYWHRFREAAARVFGGGHSKSDKADAD
jgi:hypothetical protein